MNNLNSVLIEGVVNEDSILKTMPKTGKPCCIFSVASKRYYRKDGKVTHNGVRYEAENPNGEPSELKEAGFIEEINHIGIEVWGELAEKVYDKARKGRGVRVVGRLKEYRWQNPRGESCSKVVVDAEHAEFRPEFKREEPKEPKKSDEPKESKKTSTRKRSQGKIKKE